uniref:Uncharacterized protein n=2 Tax=Pseudomonas TaxID=286 RepID=A0A2L1KHG2_PSEAI|nr:Hypothetical protein [Pseudomonas aeruginosa]
MVLRSCMMKTSFVVDEAYRQRVRDVAEATEGKIFVTPVSD